MSKFMWMQIYRDICTQTNYLFPRREKLNVETPEEASLICGKLRLALQ